MWANLGLQTQSHEQRPLQDSWQQRQNQFQRLMTAYEHSVQHVEKLKKMEQQHQNSPMSPSLQQQQLWYLQQQSQQVPLTVEQAKQHYMKKKETKPRKPKKQLAKAQQQYQQPPSPPLIAFQQDQQGYAQTPRYPMQQNQQYPNQKYQQPLQFPQHQQQQQQPPQNPSCPPQSAPRFVAPLNMLDISTPLCTYMPRGQYAWDQPRQQNLAHNLANAGNPSPNSNHAYPMQLQKQYYSTVQNFSGPWLNGGGNGSQPPDFRHR